MKIVHVEYLIDAGGFSSSEQWKTIKSHIMQAIKAIEWPPGSGAFILYDQAGKGRGEGNGVKPIKLAFMRQLKAFGWSLETPVGIATLKTPGPMDATYLVGTVFSASNGKLGISLQATGRSIRWRLAS